MGIVLQGTVETARKHEAPGCSSVSWSGVR